MTDNLAANWGNEAPTASTCFSLGVLFSTLSGPQREKTTKNTDDYGIDYTKEPGSLRNVIGTATYGAVRHACSVVIFVLLHALPKRFIISMILISSLLRRYASTSNGVRLDTISIIPWYN